jgi:hypothetical protein
MPIGVNLLFAVSTRVLVMRITPPLLQYQLWGRLEAQSLEAKL